ncbi:MULTISPECIES: ATP-binding protein [unclassified Sinorhizobium]|uniref:ATP-binding protein n=1 Tax=unclassified Sinorhizobium TaxID=2613772 RepID=UPI0035235415
MPAIQYPFIDIAVHARVRERFARGEAMVLFSADMERVLWANGAGAELFGHDAIYDFLDQGVNRSDVSFRQIETAARQLASASDGRRTFLIRITSGFQRVTVQASVEIIRVHPGVDAILFSAPVSSKPLAIEKCAARMLQGFDDPDIHMAVIGADGEILASSARFASLEMTQQTAKMLVTMATAHPDRLVKRPVSTGKGYLPAAVGKLSEDLNLLFAVETVVDHPDSVEDFEEDEEVIAPAAPLIPPQDIDRERSGMTVAPVPDYSLVIDAMTGIEEVEEAPDELVEEAGDPEPTDSQQHAGYEDQSFRHDPPQGVTPSDEASVTATEAEPPAPAVGDQESKLDVDIHEEDGVSAETSISADAEVAENPQETAIPEKAEAARNGLSEVTPSEAIAAISDKPVEQVPGTDSDFVFRPTGRATRFVWKIDAQGCFSEVSHEFAEAVGPHATKVIGVAFADIATRFNLDPEGKIAELLAKRDTWSGKTIHWPVEGTTLMVPVDLAALPTYTRSREFDGFRGFGVVRLADATEDPLRLGLTLGAPKPKDETASEAVVDKAEIAIGSEPEPAPYVEEEAPTTDKHEVPSQETSSAETEAEPADIAADDVADAPFDDRPPLRFAETPNRRLSDKIIQLHERRLSLGEGLSASEQAAFQEIAKRLAPFGQRNEEPDVVAAEPISQDQLENLTAGETTPDVTEVAVSDHTPDVEAEPVVENQAPDADGEEGEPSTKEPEAVSEPEEHFNPLEVLTTAIPPRVKMTNGLSPEVIDQLPVAIVIHTGDALIHANAEFLRITGYRSLDALAEVGGLDALLQRHDLEDKTDHPGTTMMVVRADDSLLPVTARLQSIRWEETNALMLALMPVDSRRTVATSEHESLPAAQRGDRMIEKVAKLQVEVEELQSILETATDGVVIIGSEGDIRSMNRSASALFNYDESETRGKPFVMLFAHESQKAVLDYLNGLSGHGVASVLNDGREVIGREASGGFVPLFMTMGRLTSSNGYCAVIRDITQWKRTEEELRNAKRSAETANAHKTDFLARVSHEIRTPLNAIIGFSDIMASERFGPIGHSRYIEYANDIGRSGRHVLDIVNDLLDISKIEAGEMDLEFSSVGLNEAISEAVSLVQPQANGQRVIIRTALSQSVPNVVADLRSIKQIALNILSNAIRFTPSGGQIVVSTSYEANGSVVLRVRDTGIGMTRTELEQAMKPFRQVATHTHHRGDGTGLGLPLTKAMVDANRAVFAIHSAPNEGTLVEITFPSQRVLAD